MCSVMCVCVCLRTQPSVCMCVSVFVFVYAFVGHLNGTERTETSRFGVDEPAPPDAVVCVRACACVRMCFVSSWIMRTFTLSGPLYLPLHA